MGSGKLTSQTIMEDDKKSIKTILKNIFCKKVKKDKIVEIKNKPETTVVNVNTIVENFDKLHIDKKNIDNEDADFTRKVIEEDRRTERTDSQSSQDSGFGQDADDDNAFEKKDDVVETTEKNDTSDDGEQVSQKTTEEKKSKEDAVTSALEKLQIDEKNNKEQKKKKSQTVAVKRAPIRNRLDVASHPYDHQEFNFRHINQVNQRTFSGGQVIVNPSLTTQFGELSQIATVDQELQEFNQALAGVNLNTAQVDLDLVQELIDEEIPNNTNSTENDILTDFFQNPENSIAKSLEQFVATEINQISNVEPENPIQDFNDANPLDSYDENLDTLLDFHNDQFYTQIYPTPPSAETLSPKSNYTFQTPPYSDNMSPLSNFAASPDNSLSPNSDFERCQEIPPYDETVSEHVETTDKKSRERKDSSSSLSMKQYKDLQKEIAASFSKKECCQASRKACKEIFKEYLKKVKVEERRHLCLKVASLDMKMAYGVLQNILWSLSQTDDQPEKQLALFALVCERMLSHQPAVFLGEQGLALLKSAALRCHKRPLLTRYIVQCVRVAIKADLKAVEGRQCVFTEIDEQGDNLVLACARAGDLFADVLFELTTREPYQLPLFNVHHGNTEGYTALHVACRLHSATSPRLHVTHVLLEHAGVDIWRGDVKGADTCVHLAVNSPTCDLRLLLLLFRHLDRKQWKKLAHAPNRSSVTPLELARSATKSTTRQNYPVEILEFLKKCR